MARKQRSKSFSFSNDMVQGSQDVVIDLPGSVSFEVEYYEQPKKRGMKRQLEIEIQWSEGGRTRQGVSLG